MSGGTRTFVAVELREPTFPALRALLALDREEHIAAQVAAGIGREAAEAHADDEARFPLDGA